MSYVHITYSTEHKIISVGICVNISYAFAKFIGHMV